MPEDDERVVVKTYVPRSQKEAWVDHAESMEMSQAEFLRTMVQAGRRGFDPTPEETETTDATPGGRDLEDRVLASLSDAGVLGWEDLLDRVVGHVERELDDALGALQDEGLVRYSGRHGGYVVAGDDPVSSGADERGRGPTDDSSAEYGPTARRESTADYEPTADYDARDESSDAGYAADGRRRPGRRDRPSNRDRRSGRDGGRDVDRGGSRERPDRRWGQEETGRRSRDASADDRRPPRDGRRPVEDGRGDPTRGRRTRGERTAPADAADPRHVERLREVREGLDGERGRRDRVNGDPDDRYDDEY